MTITLGTYRATVGTWPDRIVTDVTDAMVTFHFPDAPDRTITLTPADFGVWVYIAQARRDGE